MTAIAKPPAAPPPGPPGGVEGPPHRRRRPPLWLWAGALAAQIAGAALLTRSAFFFVDDYVFLNEARTQSLGLSYLREPLFEHFSPISRVLDKLLVHLAPGSFALTHFFELALYAGALIAFALAVYVILGNGWSAFAATIVFGQSIFLIRLLFWWTATANILPASIFMLLALACYLRWRENGSRNLLLGSFVAYAVALLDYESAILFPFYLAAISLLVIERRPGPRAWLATLARERWAWIVYVVMDAAAIVNYERFYYWHSALRTSPAAVLHYLEIALLETFVPALVGVRYSAGTLAIVAACLVVGAAVAVTLYLRPRAWRCLVAFILVFLITMLPVGLNRVALFGVGIGHVYYYLQPVQLMFLLLAAFAISPRWSGRRAPPAWLESRRALRVGGVVVAVAVYAAVYFTSLHALERTTRQARRDRTYLNAYLASDRSVRAATGREPVLINLKVPKAILPRGLYPYTTYGQFFALFNPQLRVNEIANPVYVVSPQGRLEATSFTTAASGLTGRSRVSTAVAAAGAPAVVFRGVIACVPAGSATAWLRVPLARAVQLNAEPAALPFALRVRFRMPLRTPVQVTLLTGGGPVLDGAATQVWKPGAGGLLIPLAVTGVAHAVSFDLPARACVTQLALGRLRHTRVGESTIVSPWRVTRPRRLSP
ncbi:MAG: hypothetical protein ABSG64_10945 [Solirubrobacteraceae bacterium]